ncbi:MAG: hypothetical protein AAF621_02610, partial [Pseudomonadota bacterium]
MVYDAEAIEHIKSVAKSTIYALCGPDKDIDVVFAANAARAVGSVIYLPEPKETITVEKWRADIDRSALKAIYYNAAIAHYYRPSSFEAAQFYDQLMVFFCDYQGAHRFRGIAKNLRFFYDDITELAKKDLSAELNPDNIFLLYVYLSSPSLIDKSVYKSLENFKDAQEKNVLEHLTTLSEAIDNFSDYAEKAKICAEYLFTDSSERGHDLQQENQDNCSKTSSNALEENTSSSPEDMAQDQLDEDIQTKETYDQDASEADVALHQNIVESEMLNPEFSGECLYDVEFAREDFQSFSEDFFRSSKADY